jgi:hypothetical protein
MKCLQIVCLEFRWATIKEEWQKGIFTHCKHVNLIYRRARFWGWLDKSHYGKVGRAKIEDFIFTFQLFRHKIASCKKVRRKEGHSIFENLVPNRRDTFAFYGKINCCCLSKILKNTFLSKLWKYDIKENIKKTANMKWYEDPWPTPIKCEK